MGLLHLLDVPLPSLINHTDLTTGSEFQTTTHTKSNNTVQLTDSEFQDNITTRVTTTNNNTDQPTESEFQTTTHTKSNNTVQLTDSESQDNTTKKDTARDTITQDVTEEELTEEEELASEDAAEVATEEEVTSRGAESSTVKMVKFQERIAFENIFICICSLFAVNKLAN